MGNANSVAEFSIIANYRGNSQLVADELFYYLQLEVIPQSVIVISVPPAPDGVYPNRPGEFWRQTIKFMDSTSLANNQITITEGSSIPKTGDLNDDSSINSSDLTIIVNKWGVSDVEADLNKSGRIDASDLAILIANWGK